MLYMIGQCITGPIKIGKANTPKARLKDMQTGCPVPLVLFAVGVMAHVETVNFLRTVNRFGLKTSDSSAYLKYEMVCHLDLKDFRLHGEWFDIGVFDAISLLDLGPRDHPYVYTGWDSSAEICYNFGEKVGSIYRGIVPAKSRHIQWVLQ